MTWQPEVDEIHRRRLLAQKLGERNASPGSTNGGS